MSNKSFKKAVPSLIAIFIGLLVGIVIIYFTNPEVASQAIPQFFMGPTNLGLRGIGDLFYHSLSLLMCGLSVGFAFKTGLFNIGASGQFMFGGFLTILFCAKMGALISPSVCWVPGLLLAGLGGGLLGALVGFLKAKRNVNEVISCIMFNYIVMYTVNTMVKSFNIYNNLKNNTIPIATKIPKMGMNILFPGTIAGGGFVLGLLITLILHLLVHRTTFGYEIQGVGLNRFAAKYAGINEKKSIILSMAISGALAGLGGGMLYLSGAGNHLTVQNVLPNEGFDGIAVALLGLSDPVGVLFSALFFAYLQMGGQVIQTLGFAPELTTMIISIILYISALSVLFRRLLNRSERRKSQGKNQDEINGPASPGKDQKIPEGRK